MTAPTRGRRYGGLDDGERRADRRRRLIDAALARFGTAGYANTTITDVCREAAVAPVHFYEAFPAKEDLLRALYDEIVETTMQAVLAALDALDDAAPDPGEWARAGLGAFCTALLTDPRRGRVQCFEVVGVSSAMENRRHEVIRMYATFLTGQIETIRGPASGPMPLAGPALEMLAIALVGGMNEAMIDWLLSEDRPPTSVLVAAVAHLYEVVAASLS